MSLLSSRKARRRIWETASVSLTPIAGKVMQQIILETVSTHVMEKKVIGSVDLQRGKHAR